MELIIKVERGDQLVVLVKLHSRDGLLHLYGQTMLQAVFEGCFDDADARDHTAHDTVPVQRLAVTQPLALDVFAFSGILKQYFA